MRPLFSIIILCLLMGPNDTHAGGIFASIQEFFYEQCYRAARRRSPFETHPNTKETRESKTYRATMKRLKINIYSQNTESVVHETYIPDIQKKFLGNYFETVQNGKTLETLFYRSSSSTRKDIEKWAERNLQGFKLVWADDLLAQSQDTQSNFYALFQEIQKKYPKLPQTIVKETGFISNELYFELSRRGYFVVGNDHDLTTHLPQMSNPETSRLTKKLAETWVRYSTSEERGKRRSIEFLWQFLQESRIVYTHANDIAFVGGYFSAFGNLMLIGSRSQRVKLMPTDILDSALSAGKYDLWDGLDRSESWQRFLKSLPTPPQTTADFANMLTATYKTSETISDDFQMTIKKIGFDRALTRFKKAITDEVSRDPLFASLLTDRTVHELIDSYLDAIDTIP